MKLTIVSYSSCMCEYACVSCCDHPHRRKALRQEWKRAKHVEHTCHVRMCGFLCVFICVCVCHSKCLRLPPQRHAAYTASKAFETALPLNIHNTESTSPNENSSSAPTAHRHQCVCLCVKRCVGLQPLASSTYFIVLGCIFRVLGFAPLS